MSTNLNEPGIDEMAAFARRHGLGALRPEYIARMCALVEPVARFGQQVQRPPHKEDAPASLRDIVF